MKVIKNLMLLIFSSLIFMGEVKSQKHNLTYKEKKVLVSLKSGNLKKFNNKQVSDFFLDKLYGRYAKYYFWEGKPGSLISLMIVYSKNVEIELELPNIFKFSKKFSEKSEWDINLIKKEKIVGANLYYCGKKVE